MTTEERLRVTIALLAVAVTFLGGGICGGAFFAYVFIPHVLPAQVFIAGMFYVGMILLCAGVVAAAYAATFIVIQAAKTTAP